MRITPVGRVLFRAPNLTDVAEARVRERFALLPPLSQGLAYSTAIVMMFLIAPAGERFIYFQF